MTAQITRLAKQIATLCSLIWNFTCVSTEVGNEVTRVLKRLATLCTLIWLFICMNSEVLGRVATTCHVVSTNMAFHLSKSGGA